MAPSMGYADGAMYSITDAYGHCGLSKFKPIEEVKRITDRYGVARANLVQHMGDAPDAAKAVERWASTGHFRGMRMTGASILTHQAVWKAASDLGLHIVVSGPFTAESAAGIVRFASANPTTQLQITHMGSPALGDGPKFPSLQPLLSMSGQKNIHVQISGMHQYSTPPYTDIIPAVARVYEAFGEERVLYASNFPVMGEDQLYGLEQHLISSGRLGIPERTAPAVMDANARRLWFSRQSLRAGSLVWHCVFG
jgi:predicted TIM-barrel fold metal-dependent hydrolase